MTVQSEVDSGASAAWPVVGALVAALVARVLATVWLSESLETPLSRAPGLGLMGPWAAAAVAATVVVGLAAGAVVVRSALRSRIDGGGRRTGRVVVGLALLGLAVGVAGGLGGSSMLVAVLVALGTVFHVVVGRFIPPVGIVSLALLVTLAGAIPNPSLAYGLPLALCMAHVTAAGLVHHVGCDGRPRMTAAGWLGVGAGWVFWTLGLTLLAASRHEAIAAAGVVLPAGPRLGVLVPLVLFGLYLGLVGAAVRWTPAPAVRSRRVIGLSAGFLAVYDLAWLVAVGMWPAAGVVGLMVLVCVPAVVAGRRLVSSTLRGGEGDRL